jgi:hypothetical protein
VILYSPSVPAVLHTASCLKRTSLVAVGQQGIELQLRNFSSLLCTLK